MSKNKNYSLIQPYVGEDTEAAVAREVQQRLFQKTLNASEANAIMARFYRKEERELKEKDLELKDRAEKRRLLETFHKIGAIEHTAEVARDVLQISAKK